ncbi:MAG: hypothetical protein GWP08_18110 [Nitrospiraceae bacterium]|nr:hypothetical protein [Nitrospiraceae bacterium]
MMWSVVLTYTACFGATLTAGEVPAAPGSQGVALPVSLALDAGEDVASLQFDVLFDDVPLALPQVIIGSAAKNAEKELSFFALGPDTVRVVIAGLNQAAIPEGPVAHALFDVDATAPEELTVVTLGYVVLSDPFGSQVDSEVVSGGVDVKIGATSGCNSPGGSGPDAALLGMVVVVLAFGMDRRYAAGERRR